MGTHHIVCYGHVIAIPYSDWRKSGIALRYDKGCYQDLIMTVVNNSNNEENTILNDKKNTLYHSHLQDGLFSERYRINSKV